MRKRRINLQFCGFGGQGLVLSATVFGTAAVHAGLNGVQTQSYGSEARGGECQAELILSQETINSPHQSRQACRSLTQSYRPVPEKEIQVVAKKAAVILSVEMNIGKYAGEIERVSGGDCRVVRVTKNRGEIHTSAEIYAAIKEAAR